jgi:hypothetical protein
VSEISHESREALQYAVDATYKSRFGPSPEQIRSDLIARLGLLNLKLDTSQIGEWTEEISEGKESRSGSNADHDVRNAETKSHAC